MAVKTKLQTSDHRALIVQLAGAGTTLVAFALVFALAKNGTNIMGWYANWFLPVGALLVGMVAASGYAIAAWFTGLKMTGRLGWSVAAELTLAYFIAQYESFHLHVAPYSSIGFFEWFDLSTRAFSFSTRNGQPGDPMGAVGYVFRALELAGFVGGGVLIPLALGSKRYCDPCRTYKRDKVIAVLPGGLYLPHLADSPYADDGLGMVNAITEAAAAGDREAMTRAIHDHGSPDRARKTRKLATFTTMTLSRCPRCGQATLASMCTENRGHNDIQVHDLGGIELEGERVRALFD